MDLFGYHLPSLAAAGAAFGAVYAAFAKFDGVQSDENRKFVRDWLLGLKADDRQWANSFIEIFASIFGPKHLSMKCLNRSAALSVALSAAIWTFIIIRGSIYEANLAASELIEVVVFWFGAVVLVDYFSLWKTRLLLTRRSLLKGGGAAIAIIIFDAAATLFFYSVIISVVYMLFLIIRHKLMAFTEAQRLTGEILDSDASARLESFNDLVHQTMFLYLAPIFTSAWLWVYLMVAYAMRTINRIPPLLSMLSKVLDFKGHPVKAIGYVAAATSALVVCLFSLI